MLLYVYVSVIVIHLIRFQLNLYLNVREKPILIQKYRQRGNYDNNECVTNMTNVRKWNL